LALLFILYLKSIAFRPIVPIKDIFGFRRVSITTPKEVSIAVFEDPAAGVFQSDSSATPEPSWENVMHNQKSPLASPGFATSFHGEKASLRTTASDHRFSENPRVNLFAAKAATSFGS
jgi:hypothetical protein